MISAHPVSRSGLCNCGIQNSKLPLPFRGLRELLLDRTGLITGSCQNSSEKSSSSAQNLQIPAPEQGNNRVFERFRAKPLFAMDFEPFEAGASIMIREGLAADQGNLRGDVSPDGNLASCDGPVIDP